MAIKVISKSSYGSYKSAWVKLWRIRANDHPLYKVGQLAGCPACHVLRAMGESYVPPICEVLCPINFNYLEEDFKVCTNKHSRYVTWKNSPTKENAMAILLNTKWDSYEVYCEVVRRFNESCFA